MTNTDKLHDRKIERQRQGGTSFTKYSTVQYIGCVQDRTVPEKAKKNK